MSFASLTRYDWTYAILIAVTMGYSYSIITVGTPILPQYFREHHIYKSHIVAVNVSQGDSTKQVFKTVYGNEVMLNGILFASYEVTQVLTQPFYGLFMRKSIRPRTVIKFVMPLFVLTTLLFALCDSYEALLASRSLQGFVGAGINTCAFTILAERFTAQTRMSILSLHGFCAGMTTRGVPALGGRAAVQTMFTVGILYDRYGKTGAFLALTVVAGIINVAWMILTVVDKKEKSSACHAVIEPLLIKSDDFTYQTIPLVPKSDTFVCFMNGNLLNTSAVSYGVLLTSITPVMMYCVRALTFYPYLMMAPLLSNRMHELVPGCTQQQIGLLLPCALVGYGIGWGVMHNIAHKQWYSHTYPIIGMMVTQSIACAVAAYATNFWQMWLSLTLMESVIITGNSANAGMLCDHVNKRCGSTNTVTANALYFIADNVGAIGGLVGGGLLVNMFGFALSWKIASGAYATIVLLMATVWLPYERRHPIRL